MCVYTHVGMSMHFVHVCLGMCSMCAHICLWVCAHVWVCACMWACTCVHICLCVHVCLSCVLNPWWCECGLEFGAEMLGLEEDSGQGGTTNRLLNPLVTG